MLKLLSNFLAFVQAISLEYKPAVRRDQRNKNSVRSAAAKVGHVHQSAARKFTMPECVMVFSTISCIPLVFLSGIPLFFFPISLPTKTICHLTRTRYTYSISLLRRSNATHTESHGIY
ncbi:hypothetical protein ARMGADRAFT_1012207 [Armillaria gallica]|uniref:Uncharacterized protein n=1 Tax=Armillaria gallica TaxID=47427 RepID=A0A2H3DJP7_ARMGA|nr:hypothetical protein ARMGADRAFT_1012207 [Armillaria gallica]